MNDKIANLRLIFMAEKLGLSTGFSQLGPTDEHGLKGWIIIGDEGVMLDIDKTLLPSTTKLEPCPKGYEDWDNARRFKILKRTVLGFYVEPKDPPLVESCENLRTEYYALEKSIEDFKLKLEVFIKSLLSSSN